MVDAVPEVVAVVPDRVASEKFQGFRCGEGSRNEARKEVLPGPVDEREVAVKGQRGEM